MCFLEEVKSHKMSSSKFNIFFQVMWVNFFKKPIDTMDNYFNLFYTAIRNKFFKWEWYEVYDFLEYLAQTDSPIDRKQFIETCNVIFGRELSAYRFVGEKIVKITDELEVNEIEEVINKTSKSKLEIVNIHLKTALLKLSDRKNPDYRNSIKESISAVEAIAKIISGNPKAELAQALKLIENSVGLHGALKKGFLSIYGYTSDADGIRHSLKEQSTCNFEDAKYMLVSCTAFINYLIVKSQKAGIKNIN